MDIVRTPTEAEKKNFTPIGTITAKDRFVKKLYDESSKAAKKGKPFAEKPALDKWNDFYNLEKTRLIRLYGYLKEEEVKTFKMDWDFFSDLTNFDLLDTGETYDSHYSKRMNAQIFLKFRKYRFKGYSNTYTVMEPVPSAWNDETIKEVHKMRNTKQVKASALSE